MLNEATRLTGIPGVVYRDHDVKTRAMLNASWVRAPLPEQKKLYDITIDLLDIYCARVSKPLLDPKMIAEEARLAAQGYARFSSHVAKCYDQLRIKDHEVAKSTLEAVLAPADSKGTHYQGKNEFDLRAIKAFRKLIFDTLLASRPDAMQDFFTLVHKYKFADSFAQQITSHDLSMKVGGAYRQWLKRQSPEVDNKPLAFVTAHKGSSPTADLEAVAQSEAMIIINDRRTDAMALRDKAVDRVQKELHIKIIDLLDCCEKALTSPHSARSKDQFFAEMAHKYSRVYALASRHYHSFTPDDRIQAEKALSVLLTISQPSNSHLARMTMEEYTAQYLVEQKEMFCRIAKESYLDLFRAVHQYGFEKQFAERAVAGILPIKMRSAYDTWAAENKNWIDHKEWLIPPVVSPVVVVTSTPAVFKSVASAPAVKQTFVAPVEDSPVQVIVPKSEIEKVAEPALPASLLKKMRREERMKGWDLTVPPVPKPVVVVKPAPEPEQIDWEELERLTQPEVESPVQEAVVSELPPVAVEPEPEVHSLLDVIKGCKNLVVYDDDVQEHSKASRKKGVGGKCLSGEDEHFPHDRRGLLTKMLMSDRVEGKYITAYCDDVDPNADVKRYPYDVIDIEFPASEDGHVEHAQVFVCNFHGFATFIRREAKPFDQEDETHISVLRDDPKVWMVPFLADDQWVRDVQGRLYTPVKDMPIQLKHSHMWMDRAAALEETFIEYVVRHGRIPDAKDTRVIEFGPLAGQATWAAGKAALGRHTVGGLESVRTYKALLAHLCDKHPELSRFVTDKPVRMCAEALKHSVLSTEDGSCVAGWEKGALNLAFQYGAVEGLDVVVPAGRSAPRRFDEFVDMCRIQP